MKRLLWIPVAFLALYLGLRAAWPGMVMRVGFAMAGTAVSGVASLAAALAFRRGDYLRTVWGAAGLGYLGFALALWPQLAPGGRGQVLFGAAVSAVAQVLAVFALWRLANYFHAAGLELPGGSRRRARVIAFIGALATAGVACALSLRDVANGDLGALTFAVSSAGDVAIVPLVVPLFLIVRGLRGGLMYWPLSLIFSSTIVWLLYDTHTALLSGGALASWSDLWLVLAVGLTTAAALAQRRVVCENEDR
jgi:hypothetical protein